MTYFPPISHSNRTPNNHFTWYILQRFVQFLHYYFQYLFIFFPSNRPFTLLFTSWALNMLSKCPEIITIICRELWDAVWVPTYTHVWPQANHLISLSFRGSCLFCSHFAKWKIKIILPPPSLQTSVPNIDLKHIS